jgi:glycosyltransferase involved in cell wall biosynthesis
MHREPFTPELSVVIPVYNEEAGLAALFAGCTQRLTY